MLTDMLYESAGYKIDTILTCFFSAWTQVDKFIIWSQQRMNESQQTEGKKGGIFTLSEVQKRYKSEDCEPLPTNLDDFLLSRVGLGEKGISGPL